MSRKDFPGLFKTTGFILERKRITVHTPLMIEAFTAEDLGELLTERGNGSRHNKPPFLIFFSQADFSVVKTLNASFTFLAKRIGLSTDSN
jgi:hypothetical protein